MSWRGLQVAVDGIHLDQVLILLIEPVYLYLVCSVVNGKDISAVRHPSGTGNMGAEIALCHAAITLVVHLVHNLPNGAVLIQAQDRGLAVMVTGHEHIFILHVGAQMAAPHAAYR